MNSRKKLNFESKQEKKKKSKNSNPEFCSTKNVNFSDMKDKLLEDKKEGVKMHFSVYVYYGHCSTYRVTRQVSQKLGEVLLLGHNNIHFPIKTIFAAKFSVFLDGA